MSAASKDTLVHGVIAGSIGYAIVAIAFCLLNLIEGRPIYTTAAQLGAWLLGRGVVAPALPLDAAPVIAFNGVHLVLMLGAGVIASLLVHIWEIEPRAGFFVFFVFVASVIAGLLASVAVFAGLLRTVSVFDLVWINIVGAASVAAYLLITHPRARGWPDE